MRSTPFMQRIASVIAITLAGTFQDAAATTVVNVNARIDAEGVLGYEVRPLLAGRQTDNWTNLTAAQDELSGTNAAGDAVDVTISGNQLVGTLAGTAVTLQRQCGP